MKYLFNAIALCVFAAVSYLIVKAVMMGMWWFIGVFFLVLLITLTILDDNEDEKSEETA